MSYAHPEYLVETDWVADHLNNASVRIIESDEDPLLYAVGHIPGAVQVDWFSTLQHPLRRDFLTKEQFEAVCSKLGIGNATVKQMNAEKLDFGSGSFDAVVAATAIEQVPDPFQALRELSSLDISPSRLVLEIAESTALGDAELKAFVDAYRDCGFRIALDDFGAGASNYDRVLALQPDIVRMAPALVRNAEHSPRAARLFPHMVSLLREASALALVGTTASADGSLQILAQAPSGTFSQALTLPLTDIPTALAAADLAGNGGTDLVVGPPNRTTPASVSLSRPPLKTAAMSSGAKSFTGNAAMARAVIGRPPMA